MEFSDYIIFVDESGDHGLKSIDKSYPIFCLAFCIFKKETYAREVVPLFKEFKFKWFGHDCYVLHESDIVKKRFPFNFLQYDNKRDLFMEELSNLIDKIDMTVVATVIEKELLVQKYETPGNPYELSLLFCMESAFSFLSNKRNEDKVCHIICESRSPREKAGKGKEDSELKSEFRRISEGSHYLQNDMRSIPSCFDIHFVAKLANSCGLQIADLIARPIGLHVLRPDQYNRAFDIISKKIWKSPSYGLKKFP